MYRWGFILEQRLLTTLSLHNSLTIKWKHLSLLPPTPLTQQPLWLWFHWQTHQLSFLLWEWRQRQWDDLEMTTGNWEIHEQYPPCFSSVFVKVWVWDLWSSFQCGSVVQCRIRKSFLSSKMSSFFPCIICAVSLMSQGHYMLLKTWVFVVLFYIAHEAN